MHIPEFKGSVALAPCLCNHVQSQTTETVHPELKLAKFGCRCRASPRDCLQPALNTSGLSKLRSPQGVGEPFEELVAAKQLVDDLL